MLSSALSIGLGLLAGLTPVLADVPACPGPAPASSPMAAPGVEYKVLINGLERPRGVVLDKKGNLLVVESKGKGVRRIVLNSAPGLDVCVESSSQIVTESTLNHGIALSKDGKTLFVSSLSTVFAYPYNACDGTVGEGKKVVIGMDQGGHSTRTLLVPRHNPDMLLVSRGSDGNIDEPTQNITSARSQLRSFNIASLLASSDPVQYSSGDVIGWGLRNSVGVADDPCTGNIWTVENSIDNMMRHGDDIHNSNPGEELNYHGRPNDTSSDVYGKNFGYPGCVAIIDTSNVKDFPDGAAVGKHMAGDQIKTVDDNWCQENTVAPKITFSSHIAPLDVHFLQDGSAALISFHGSWNRQPPNGYRLSRVSFEDGMPVARSDSSNAEEHLLWNADNAKCPSGCFRPVGLAVDHNGRVFMGSDATGEIYVVTGAHNKGVTN